MGTRGMGDSKDCCSTTARCRRIVATALQKARERSHRHQFPVVRIAALVLYRVSSPPSNMGKGKKLKHPLLHSEPLFTTQDDIEYGRQQQHSDTDTTDDDVVMEDEEPENTYTHNSQSLSQPLDTHDSEEQFTQTQSTQDIDTQASNLEDEVDEEARVDAPAPSTSTQNTKKKRKPAEDQATAKRRTYYHIPEDKEAALAEWYREQEFLYNKKLRAYRDRDRKARAWEEKGKAFGVPGEYQNHGVCPY